jgi:pimeloyl-ACP methyl ester carboxylesterase
MVTERRLLRLADGRDIEFLTAGPADGVPLVVHEGTPVGLVINNRLGAAAADRGLRLVQVARPGYVQSTAQPGRRVADIANDVAEVLDDIGSDTFVSIGFSGGGPHSIACAALLPGRCLAAASVAGVGPHGVDGLDFLAGMAPENVEEFGLAIQGEEVLTPFLEKNAAVLRGITGEQIVDALAGLISGADAAVLTGEFADSLAAGLRSAVSNGVAGWRDDDLAFAADWGFWPDAHSAPIAIWQGDQDNMVPFAHGRWLAARIPGARVHLEPGAGHLTMTVTAIDRILDELLDLSDLPRG